MRRVEVDREVPAHLDHVVRQNRLDLEPSQGLFLARGDLARSVPGHRVPNVRGADREEDPLHATEFRVGNRLPAGSRNGVLGRSSVSIRFVSRSLA